MARATAQQRVISTVRRRAKPLGVRFLLGGLVLAGIGLAASAHAAPRYRRLGLLGVQQATTDQVPVRLDTPYVRAAMIGELRSAGLSVLPPDAPLERDAAVLLSGDVESVECLARDQKLNCRASIRWAVRDGRSGTIFYRTVTRVAEYDVGRLPVGQVTLRLAKRSLASLLARPGFRQTQFEEERPSPTYPPASFKRCTTPSPKMPSQAEEATHATVVLTDGRGVGAGFFLNEEGLVLTAAHVARVPDLRAHLRDGTDHPMGVVRIHPHADVALMRVELPRPVRCLDASPKPPTLGADVYAIGNPFGAAQAFSLSRGIVSALRDIEGLHVLQTDAAVSPGNSGGPLLGTDGKVLAVVSFKVIQQGVEGVGYGVSMDAALDALGLEPAASTGAELAVLLPPMEAPKAVWETDDALPSLEPSSALPGDPARPAALEPDADRPPPARAPSVPAHVNVLRWGGLGTALAGLALIVKSEMDYDRDSTTRDEFSSLATLNDVGWTFALLGGGAMGASFLLGASASSSNQVVAPRGRGVALGLGGSF